jgi:hypothetical protein
MPCGGEERVRRQNCRVGAGGIFVWNANGSARLDVTFFAGEALKSGVEAGGPGSRNRSAPIIGGALGVFFIRRRAQGRFAEARRTVSTLPLPRVGLQFVRRHMTLSETLSYDKNTSVI